MTDMILTGFIIIAVARWNRRKGIGIIEGVVREMFLFHVERHPRGERNRRWILS